MRTHVLALLAALLLLMCLGAGTATAQEQVAGQESGSEQTANSEANAVQVAPSNRNVDVRIWSEGDSGGVEQTNAAGAAAVSGNSNQTDQSASQDQSGAGTQIADQGASNEQYAGAEANGVQVKPSNDNVVVRIDSPGKDGPVEQTNAAGALAAAGNDNSTTQSADQEQGGGHCCKDGGGTQIADQKAHNDQDADAEANAVQIKPSNKNVSVRIDSPGDNGPVKQTNAALAGAAAGNANETTQSADQSQDGGCKCGGGLQVADQKAKSEQDADAEANAVQIAPSNKNTSVRIDSKGDDGPVKQTNVALAGALAGNANDTDQSATQSQGGGGEQIADQSAYNDQDADAKANAIQKYPSNDNTSVRVGSPGSSGSVTQTNAALAGAMAVNHNDTTQSADQYQAGDSCKCHGGGLQVASQKSDSEQDADADANAIQVKPSNSNTAVDLGGKKQCGCPKDHGGGGDVEQTNVAGALGIALNGNSTGQSATQDQGDSCKCHGGDGVQVAAQSAYNDQDAYADANAVQVKPSNDNTSVGGSGGGSVSQTNAALAGAIAGNLNETTQSADQSGGGVQVIAQKSDSEQDADADANAIQLYPYNGNTSVGGSGGGSVSQTNAALAGALAGNLNTTYQSADQSQDGGSCKCGGGGEQIVAQSAYNDQYAGSEANAVQKHPSNSNTPVHIGGGKKQCGCPKDHGGGGDVEQANIAAALGIALNANSTDQSATQSQRGDSCKCHGGGLQVAAQKAKNKQDADASANALQFGASNSNSPVRIWSTGGSGSVRQANLALALGIAANLNKTKQEANQTQ